MKIRKVIFTILGATAVFHLAFAAFFGLKLISYIESNPDHTSLMRFRNNESTPPSFTALDHIPADFVSSVIFVEDADFFRHLGFDLDSIRLAIQVNKKLGYPAYGGSTITQQLARTLFLTPKKNYIRKYFELIIALEAEIFLTKERILELYLNYAEWGKNIYGVTDAATHYYHTGLWELDETQILELITIMANPIDFAPETFKQSGMLTKRYNALKLFYDEMKKLPPRFKSSIEETG